MCPHSNSSSTNAQNGSASSNTSVYQHEHGTSAYTHTSHSNTAAASTSQARYPGGPVPPRRPSQESATYGDDQPPVNGHSSDSDSTGYYPIDRSYFLPTTVEDSEDNTDYARELTVDGIEEEQAYNPPSTPPPPQLRQRNSRGRSSASERQGNNLQPEAAGVRSSRSPTTERWISEEASDEKFRLGIFGSRNNQNNDKDDKN